MNLGKENWHLPCVLQSVRNYFFMSGTTLRYDRFHQAIGVFESIFLLIPQAQW